MATAASSVVNVDYVASAALLAVYLTTHCAVAIQETVFLAGLANCAQLMN